MFPYTVTNAVITAAVTKTTRDPRKEKERLETEVRKNEKRREQLKDEVQEKKKKIEMKEKERDELWKKMTEVIKEMEKTASRVTFALGELPLYDRQIMTRKAELDEITQKLASDLSSLERDRLQQRQRETEHELGVAEANGASCRFRITAYTRPANAYVQLEVHYTRLGKYCAALYQECDNLQLEYDLLEQEHDKLRSELAYLQNIE